MDLFKSIIAFTLGLIGVVFVIALELALDCLLSYAILWLISLFAPVVITFKLVIAVTAILICLSIIFKK